MAVPFRLGMRGYDYARMRGQGAGHGKILKMDKYGSNVFFVFNRGNASYSNGRFPLLVKLAGQRNMKFNLLRLGQRHVLMNWYDKQRWTN